MREQEYPIRDRNDTSLDTIRSFALACWIQDFPHAVVGDVWKHKPNDKVRAQGAIIQWQANIYVTPRDLEIYDTTLRIAENYPPGDENEGHDARKRAKEYAAKAGKIDYHGTFIGQHEDGSLFLMSKMAYVERREQP